MLGSTVTSNLQKLMKKDINLVLRPNYHTTKCFSKNLLAVELQKASKNRQTCIFRYINLDTKIAKYEYLYDCIKPKYEANVKLYYMDPDSFIVRGEKQVQTLQSLKPNKWQM